MARIERIGNDAVIWLDGGARGRKTKRQGPKRRFATEQPVIPEEPRTWGTPAAVAEPKIARTPEEREALLDAQSHARADDEGMIVRSRDWMRG